MGGFCAKISALDSSPGEIILQAKGVGDNTSMVHESCRMEQQSTCKTMPVEETMDKQLNEISVLEMSGLGKNETGTGKLQLSKTCSHKSSWTGSKSTSSGRTRMTKVTEASLLLGRAGTVGIMKAVDVFDMLGSSMTSLKSGSSFERGAKTKGKEISILAFEVANTIVKGANLMQSLASENIKHLKEVVLPSEGVQRLVSNDTSKLVRIAAADKREELRVFSGEVVRFGNQCKNPRWHNLDRYFAKLNSEFTPKVQLKEKALGATQYLITLVRRTAELYHEMYDLGKFEQDYQQRLKEIELPVEREDTLLILKKELKSQHKQVKSLKKKSLWSKSLEEVMEKLMDIALFLHLEVDVIFGITDGDRHAEGSNGHERLGLTGLALHYANVIIQIVTLIMRPSSVPPSTRDALYQALPSNVKSALRSKLQSDQLNKELSVQQIKAEMEKILLWLVPIVNNTISIAHQGFGWVGEWAKRGTEMNQRATNQPGLFKIETLHHADKAKTEKCILDLVVWLHHLVIHSRPRNVVINSPIRSPICSPATKRLLNSSPVKKSVSSSSAVTLEGQQMLQDVNLQGPAPGIYKRQEVETCRPTRSKHKLSNCSNNSSNKKEFISTTDINIYTKKRDLRYT
ncbi:hypothetical protein Cni_G06064 [Canna indica]|uniref:Uncharacterized protein n=1 Tax=Canna indica TaxID=4628 RepID=A0AAQ3JWH5_9LILI|nr:hypothetical protein Cni_G06064 [Canna indica]